MQLIFVAAGKKVLMTHGHLYGVYYSRKELISTLKQSNCKLGLFGHTHVPFQDRVDDLLLLNPGSVSVPRNHSDKSCAVLTIYKDKSEIEYQFHSLET